MSRVPDDFRVYSRNYNTKSGPVTTWWVAATISPGERVRLPLGIKGEGQTARLKAERAAQTMFAEGGFREKHNHSPLLSKYCEDFFLKLKTDITPVYRRSQQGMLKNHVLPKLGHLRLDQLTVKKLEEWAHGLDKSAVRAFVALNLVLEEAVRLEDLDQNRLARIQWNRPKDKQRGFLTVDEVKDLFAHPEYFESEKGYLLNALAAIGGAREGELVVLRPDDIGDGVVHIRALHRVGVGLVEGDTKTGAMGIHDAGVPTWLTDRLKAFSKGRQWVFPSPRKGEHVSTTYGLVELRKALDAAKIDRVGRRIVFHSWRKWSASTLSGLGVSPTATDFHLGHTIQAVAGIQSNTLGIYLKQTPAHVDEVRAGWLKLFPEPFPAYSRSSSLPEIGQT